MPTLDRAELEDVRLYLDLAWRLGMLHAQMDRGTLKSARLIYRGEVAAQEHQADHGELRRRADGNGASSSRSTWSTPCRWPASGACEIEEAHGRGPRRLRHHDPERGDDRTKDVRGRRDPLRQAVPPPGAPGFLPARRPHGRHPSRLHPPGPPGPDRLHRQDPGRRGSRTSPR